MVPCILKNSNLCNGPNVESFIENRKKKEKKKKKRRDYLSSNMDYINLYV